MADAINISTVTRGDRKLPAGCRVAIGADGRAVLTASCRDSLAAMQMFSLAIVWTGIVGVVLIFTLSESFPDANLAERVGFAATDKRLPRTTLHGYWLLTTLLLGVGMLLWLTATLATWGVVRVSFDGTYLRTFTGVGPLGRSRVIAGRSIRRVRVAMDDSLELSDATTIVQIERPRGETVHLGVSLSDAQQAWLADTINSAIARLGPFDRPPRAHAFA